MSEVATEVEAKEEPVVEPVVSKEIVAEPTLPPMGRIVRARQEANRVFYSLVDEHARTLVTQAVFQAQHAVGEQSAHHGPAGRR